MDKGTTSTGLVIVHGPTLRRALLEESKQQAVMEYCKMLLFILCIQNFILFNIYIVCYLSYNSCFWCSKKCFLSGDYNKIVSNTKQLMLDPCSRFVFFFMFLLLFSIFRYFLPVFFFFFFFFLFFFFLFFFFGPLWVLISGQMTITILSDTLLQKLQSTRRTGNLLKNLKSR